MRGVKFVNGWPTVGYFKAASNALRDVRVWLGFSTIPAYTRKLYDERSRIFKRAKY